jgi:hypothetical protein
MNPTARIATMNVDRSMMGAAASDNPVRMISGPDQWMRKENEHPENNGGTILVFQEFRIIP